VVTRTSLFVPLIVVLFFVSMLFIIISEDPNARLAFGQTETVIGTVAETADGDACQGRGRDISYVFKPEGGPEYKSIRSVCRGSRYFDASSGDSVPVRFLVADPAVSGIDGERGSSLSFYVPFLLLPIFFALFFFAPFLLPQLWRLVRDRKLFRDGRVVPAVVVFVKQRATASWPGWPSFAAREMFVSFKLPSGVEAEARVACYNEWLLSHLPPGAVVHIAYLPDDPARGALLEAYLR
jgi:hypothetical protein